MRLFALLFLGAALSALTLSLRVPRVETWTRLGDYPKRVFEAQGSVFQARGLRPTQLICGGFENFPNVTAACYKRRIGKASNKWQAVRSMPAAITHMAQAYKGSRMYVAGGYYGPHPGRSVRNAYVYNLAKDKWSKLPFLPADRAGGGMLYIKDKVAGKRSLIFAGGGDRDSTMKSGKKIVEKHVDYGNTWELDLKNIGKGWVDRKSDMPDPRNHQGAVESCGRYFWVGGQHKENEMSGNRATVNEYFPRENRWGSIANMPIPLSHVSASTLAYNCGIIVIGGVTNNKERSNLIFFWESSRNEWYIIGEYPIKLATPVCGIRGRNIYCSTGSSIGKDRAYVTTLKMVAV